MHYFMSSRVCKLVYLLPGCTKTYRDKFLKADLSIFVCISSNEGLDDLSHLVAWKGEACLFEQLLKLPFTHIAAVINIWTQRHRKYKNGKSFPSLRIKIHITSLLL